MEKTVCVGVVGAGIISDVYLPGLLIGYVEETVTDANRLLRSGSLRPVADFDNLDMVLVITTLKGTEETP